MLANQKTKPRENKIDEKTQTSLIGNTPEKLIWNSLSHNPANIYLFKANNRDTRKRRET